MRWVLPVRNLSIFRTAASKPAALSFVEQNIFSSLFPIIGLGPYTVGVKIKDFNSGVGIILLSSRCNTAAHRHHERTGTDMDVIEVGAAFPHIFDQQVTRKALILDIGVCIMEEK